jgi:hypothetical protein
MVGLEMMWKEAVFSHLPVVLKKGRKILQSVRRADINLLHSANTTLPSPPDLHTVKIIKYASYLEP